MKKLNFFTLTLLLICGCFQLNFAQQTEIEKRERTLYDPSTLTDGPIWPGCNEEEGYKRHKCFNESFDLYVEENMQYPEAAQEAGTKGTIFIRFVIGLEGRPQEVTIFTGGDASLEEEALRLVNNIPNITPGKVDGIAVATYHTVKIKFKPED